MIALKRCLYSVLCVGKETRDLDLWATIIDYYMATREILTSVCICTLKFLVKHKGMTVSCGRATATSGIQVRPRFVVYSDMVI